VAFDASYPDRAKCKLAHSSILSHNKLAAARTGDTLIGLGHILEHLDDTVRTVDFEQVAILYDSCHARQATNAW